MESRKYQLQKQIIEALKANDDNLFSLLKSQWAHRFGVESLDELSNLDFTIDNENLTNEDTQKDNESQDYFCEVDKEIPLKEDYDKEKEIGEKNKEVVKSDKVEGKELFEINTYEKLDEGNYENKAINPAKENKIPPKIEALIPLPPNPKYSYLKKWLL